MLRAILRPSSGGGTSFYLAKGQGVENDLRRDDFGLSREKQETIINFNKAEKLASIFTYDRRWQKHLEKHLRLTHIKDNGFGGREYELDKHLIRLPLKKRQYSSEQNRRLAVRLQTHRPKKRPK